MSSRGGGPLMRRNIEGLGGLLFLMLALANSAAGGQPGVTETVFNRRFIPTMRPLMTYEQIVKLAGVPGLKTGEDRKEAPPVVQYRWMGGRDSVLTAKFRNNKMIEATVLAPNKHTYLVKSNGEVVDKTN